MLQREVDEGVMHTAFARSSQQTARALWLECASLRTEESLRWCSIHPGTVGIKAFCREGSRYLLAIMYPSHRFLRRVVNSLPMHGVSAIGRKLPGLVASSAAEVLGMSVMACSTPLG